MSAVMQWLRQWFAQPDKALHFIVGAVAYSALLYLTRSVPAPGALRATAILAVVAVIAWGKERYDKTRPDTHTWSGWDAFATLAGGLACALGWAWLAAR